MLGEGVGFEAAREVGERLLRAHLQGELRQGKEREVGSSWYCPPGAGCRDLHLNQKGGNNLFPENCSSYLD